MWAWWECAPRVQGELAESWMLTFSALARLRSLHERLRRFGNVALVVASSIVHSGEARRAAGRGGQAQASGGVPDKEGHDDDATQLLRYFES